MGDLTWDADEWIELVQLSIYYNGKISVRGAQMWHHAWVDGGAGQYSVRPWVFEKTDYGVAVQKIELSFVHKEVNISWYKTCQKYSSKYYAVQEKIGK